MDIGLKCHQISRWISGQNAVDISGQNESFCDKIGAFRVFIEKLETRATTSFDTKTKVVEGVKGFRTHVNSFYFAYWFESVNCRKS